MLHDSAYRADDDAHPDLEDGWEPRLLPSRNAD
jgi:hypothetical protein